MWTFQLLSFMRFISQLECSCRYDIGTTPVQITLNGDESNYVKQKHGQNGKRRLGDLHTKHTRGDYSRQLHCSVPRMFVCMCVCVCTCASVLLCLPPCMCVHSLQCVNMRAGAWRALPCDFHLSCQNTLPTSAKSASIEANSW